MAVYREYFNVFTILRYFSSFVFGIVELLLVLRFSLKLFAANPQTPFVQWIFDNTSQLIAPFAGIFTSPNVEGGFIFESSTLFAIIAYAILYFAIIELVALFERMSSHRTVVVE